MNNAETKLQVLICAYGKDGIERIAKSRHPSMKGVEYIISWQKSEGCPIPENLKREDFKIFTTDSVGLARNRNYSLSKATAEILLISDDDVDYDESGLKNVIRVMEDNPNIDIATFRYDSKSSKKNYPESSIDLRFPPKGYYISSIEIAFRREAVQGKIWFNENFGIGATFPSGEEDIFIKDCLNLNLSGKYFPISIARHDGLTTSGKNLHDISRPQTKGAVFIHIHPISWPLRMIAHTLREIPLWKKGLGISPISYCKNWMIGAIRAKKEKIFPTHDGSNKYSCYE